MFFLSDNLNIQTLHVVILVSFLFFRSWLDIFKRGILQSLMWITLAIVFLAGTNRVNLFSIGYLIGSFIFLWQGSDLYLKPIPKVLKS